MSEMCIKYECSEHTQCKCFLYYLKQIKAELDKIIVTEIASDDEDFNVLDDSGANFDNAYRMGIDTGEKYLAKKIKPLLEQALKELEGGE